ncbi:MAG: hypothetical protein GX969_02485 [Firmicutes bacterium]|jgi:hypothetical protein|nr:hypothetical protein [Bacillota bacterium]
MKLYVLKFLGSIRTPWVFLIVFTLLLSQGICAANNNTSTMAITCNILPAIGISFPTELELGSIAPDFKRSGSYVLSDLQYMKVWSNTEWALKIQSDSPDGRMQEWTGTEYADRILSSPLEWQLDSESIFNRITGNEELVIEGGQPTDEDGTAIGIRFRQYISYGDSPILSPGNNYKIEVTLTAIQTY